MGRYTYLVLLLGWALPVLALQWAVAGRALWQARRLLIATILICGTYLSIADHLAIARGIWQIPPGGVVGIRFFQHLPLEEALFYYLTSALSAQGFVMIAGHFRPRGERL